ncbi:MAG TPA: hypothetical protein VFP94_07310, partial [Terriglobales bacterium]|nr:hypothetical protein [Terriglobales bacterium]
MKIAIGSRRDRRAVLLVGLTWILSCVSLAAQLPVGTAASKAPLTLYTGGPRSLHVAQAFGALTDRVPIVVPPGRHDVEPHLFLDYSSTTP